MFSQELAHLALRQTAPLPTSSPRHSSKAAAAAEEVERASQLHKGYRPGCAVEERMVTAQSPSDLQWGAQLASFPPPEHRSSPSYLHLQVRGMQSTS